MAITHNYKIQTSINSNNFLTVEIKDIDGNNLTDSNYNDFLVNETWVRAKENKSVTLPSTNMMDIVTKKLDSQDIQLFLYAINNGGQLELGLSRIPAFTKVPDEYADNTNKRYEFSNFIMSGTKATGTVYCEVIGRIRAKQNSSYQWISPTKEESREGKILETDYLISGCGIEAIGNLEITSYSTDFCRYKIISDRIKLEARWHSISTLGTGENALELKSEPLSPLNDQAIIGSAKILRDSGILEQQGLAYGYDSTAVGATHTVRVSIYDFSDFGAGTSGGAVSVNLDYEYEKRVSLPS